MMNKSESGGLLSVDHLDRQQQSVDLAPQVSLTGLAAWLPRRVLLAIDVMLDVAFNGTAGPLSAAVLAERQGLETRKLEAVLQRLSRAGLLKSVRGPSGGYLLGGEKAAITVGGITQAVLGGDTPVALEQSPSPTMRKVVLPVVEKFHENMLADMEKVNLGELCRLSRLAGLKSTCDGIIDFVI